MKHFTAFQLEGVEFLRSRRVFRRNRYKYGALSNSMTPFSVIVDLVVVGVSLVGSFFVSQHIVDGQIDSERGREIERWISAEPSRCSILSCVSAQ